MFQNIWRCMYYLKSLQIQVAVNEYSIYELNIGLKETEFWIVLE